MDMVTMNIMNTTLVSICKEMGVMLMKTAYSTIFNECLDFSCGIANAKGEMVGIGEFCPSQTGCIPTLMENFMKEFPPETLKPGDVMLHNDPHRGGLHIPEHTFVKPIFYNGEIVAYTIAVCHFAEIGGKVVGGFAVDAYEIYQEGIRVPPVKIVKEGKDDVDLWKFYLANVRTPRYNYGDMRAIISALDLGERRLKTVIDKYGLDVYNQTTKDLLDYSERLMRAEIAELPNGVYSYEDCMEGDGITDKLGWIRVKLHIFDDEIVVDYTGTDPQMRGAVNTTYTVSLAAAYNALFYCTTPDIPRNSGGFRPVHVINPAGSITNVNFPGAEVVGNTEGHTRLAQTIIACFAQANPQRCMAAEGATHTNFLFGGHHPDRDEAFAAYLLEGNGWGARPDRDGNSAVDAANGNCAACPTEVTETRYPWIVEQWSLHEDSAGAGKWRGGFGISKTYRALAPMTITEASDRHETQPYGLFGGKPGKSGATYIKLNGMDEWGTAKTVFGKPCLSKFTDVQFNVGDRIWFKSPGGGGYGDPLERDKEMVLEDYREGYISEETARNIYKVEV